jgi:hypothetical protein
MNLWMVKQEKNGFTKPNKMMKEGVMFKIYLLPQTQIQIYIYFTIFPHHFWRVPIYFYARLRRITYYCNVISSFR